MTVEQFLGYYPEVVITPEQLACCRFLEGRGKRFLIDFGYENAGQQVWDFLNPEEPYCRPGTQLDLFLDYTSGALDRYQRVLFSANG